jgi:hypothetical protein
MKPTLKLGLTHRLVCKVPDDKTTRFVAAKAKVAQVA